MEDNEIVEQTTDTENVDTLSTEELEERQDTTEAPETTETVEEEKEVEKFTQEEVNQIVQERLRRQESKIRNEYEEKYSKVETVLNAGLGTDNIEDATNKLTEFYKSKGINIPEHKLTAREEQILADAEANDIIADGYDELVREVDRLANKGADNLTSKEKLIFTKLAAERTTQEAIKDLAKIGVGQEVLEDKEFKEFSNKLNPKLSVKEKYEMYEKLKPKKEIETIGSMKNTPNDKDKGVKDFYTRDEALKFTREDFDKNPELFKAVERSMAKW